jgi:hypothetical protein
MQEIFRNMQFPIRKEQIIEHARKQNASSDVIEDLQMIPDREYESADSLMRAMESAGQTAGGGGGKSQGFGGTGTGGSGGGGPSTGGSSQSFGGRGGK